MHGFWLCRSESNENIVAVTTELHNHAGVTIAHTPKIIKLAFRLVETRPDLVRVLKGRLNVTSDISG